MRKAEEARKKGNKRLFAKKWHQASKSFAKALRLNPAAHGNVLTELHNQMGWALQNVKPKRSRVNEAVHHYRLAYNISLRPAVDHSIGSRPALNLASHLDKDGRFLEAAVFYRAAIALELERVHKEARARVGLLPGQQGYDPSTPQAKALAEVLPPLGEPLRVPLGEAEGVPRTITSLGQMLLGSGHTDEAVHEFRRALAVVNGPSEPLFAELVNYLGNANALRRSWVQTSRAYAAQHAVAVPPQGAKVNEGCTRGHWTVMEQWQSARRITIHTLRPPAPSTWQFTPPPGKVTTRLQDEEERDWQRDGDDGDGGDDDDDFDENGRDTWRQIRDHPRVGVDWGRVRFKSFGERFTDPLTLGEYGQRRVKVVELRGAVLEGYRGACLFLPPPSCTLFVGEHGAPAVPIWNWGYPHCQLKVRPASEAKRVPHTVLSLLDSRGSHNSFYHLVSDVVSRLVIFLDILDQRPGWTLDSIDGDGDGDGDSNDGSGSKKEHLPLRRVVNRWGSTFKFLLPVALAEHVSLLSPAFPQWLHPERIEWFHRDPEAAANDADQRGPQHIFQRYVLLDWETYIRPATPKPRLGRVRFDRDMAGTGVARTEAAASGTSGKVAWGQGWSVFQDSIWELFHAPWHALLLQQRWLRDAAKVPQKPVPAGAPHVVYITRREQQRRVLKVHGAEAPLFDEPLVAALRARVEREGGLLSVFQGNQTIAVRNTAQIFGTADVIVGSHGGAMMNMVYATPGTAVVLFPTTDAWDPLFSHVATALGHDFVLLEEPLCSFWVNYSVTPEVVAQVAGQVGTVLVQKSLAKERPGDVPLPTLDRSSILRRRQRAAALDRAAGNFYGWHAPDAESAATSATSLWQGRKGRSEL